LWSIAYRSNPIEDVHIAPWRRGVQGSIYSGGGTDSAMLIDATLKHKMPPLALPAREFMDGARKIWERLGLPPLTIRQPWHGYELGDWTDTWETFARRAIGGDWEANGEDTLRRQRDGVEPETPVWQVEVKETK
jgi:4-hydroxy-3-polyprenylbenzoate decarboxylase